MKSKDALQIIKGIAGDENYEKIMAELSGMTVYFPENYEWQNKMVRNTSLREDYYSGVYEIADLAMKYGLSISSVYKIIQHRE